MKQQNQGEALHNPNERAEQNKNSNSQLNDPRARKWGLNYEENDFKTQPMSHAPKRDTSGERKDVASK